MPANGSASPKRHALGGVRPSQRLSGGKSASQKAAPELDNSSECSDKHSEAGSQQSMDDFKHHKEFFRQSRLVVGSEKFREDLHLKLDVAGKSVNEDVELLGLGDADSEERLSDISDGVLSMGTETDGSINSIVECTLFPETTKPPAEMTEKRNVPIQLPRPPKQGQAGSSRSSLSKSSSKPPSAKKPVASSSALKPPKKWQ